METWTKGCYLLGFLMCVALIPSSLSAKLTNIHNDQWAVTQFNASKFEYLWTVNNFSLYDTANPIDSPIFTSQPNGSYNWRLHLYPLSNTEDVGLYLNYIDGNGDGARIKYNLTLLNSNRDVIASYNNNTATIWEGGFYGKSMAKRKDVLSRLADDKLLIHAEIEVNLGISSISGNCSTAYNATNQLSDHLGKYIGSTEFSDATISTNSTNIQVHKVIFASRSLVFESRLQNEATISITNYSLNAVNEMLYYVYTGRINHISEELCELAAEYDIVELKKRCSKYLCTHLDFGHAIDSLIYADKIGDEDLIRKVSRFIAAHISTIVNTEKFKYLEASHPQLLAYIVEALAGHSL